MSFCYFQNYDQKGGTDRENVHHDLSVFLAADRYDIPCLQELTRGRLMDWLDANWASKEFLGIVQEIWSCVPRHAIKLRDKIVELVAIHIQHFISQADTHDIGNLELVLVKDGEGQSYVEVPYTYKKLSRMNLPAARSKGYRS